MSDRSTFVSSPFFNRDHAESFAAWVREHVTNAVTVATLKPPAGIDGRDDGEILAVTGYLGTLNMAYVEPMFLDYREMCGEAWSGESDYGQLYVTVLYDGGPDACVIDMSGKTETSAGPGFYAERQDRKRLTPDDKPVVLDREDIARLTDFAREAGLRVESFNYGTALGLVYEANGKSHAFRITDKGTVGAPKSVGDIIREVISGMKALAGSA